MECEDSEVLMREVVGLEYNGGFPCIVTHTFDMEGYCAVLGWCTAEGVHGCDLLLVSCLPYQRIVYKGAERLGVQWFV